MRSQNGFPAGDRSVINTVTVPGTDVRIPVRRGPAGDLLIWAAARWHREVEPLTPGHCWGYAFRAIRGSSTTLSNHASGTAIDLNAPKHPLGVAAWKTFSPGQLDAVRRIVADARGCLRWGGEWSRPDGMHLEVAKDEAQCTEVLRQLAGGAYAPAGEWIDMEVGMGATIPVLRRGDGLQGAPGERGRLHWYVFSLQALLNVRGLSKIIPVDGVFGASTEAMVRELQQRAGITVDGICGRDTWTWALGNDAPEWI